MKPQYIPKDSSARIFRLVKELGELQAAIGKAVRWGMQSVNPELPPALQETNAEWIKREMADVRHAINQCEPDIDAQIAKSKA